MNAGAGLDTGLFVGADDVVPRSERLSFPPPLIEVEDAAGFGGEIRVAGENPAPVGSGFDGVGVEPAPDRGPADPAVSRTTSLRIASRTMSAWLNRDKGRPRSAGS